MTSTAAVFRSAAVVVVLAGALPALAGAPARRSTQAALSSSFNEVQPQSCFSPKTYADALKSIEGTQKILLVYCVTYDSAPCKAMTDGTWHDGKVSQWVRANGLAIMVITNKSPDIVQKFDIRGVPTTIAIREGKEIGRIVGEQSAEQLMTWFETIKQGKGASTPAPVRTSVPAEPNSVDARHALARQLTKDGQLDKAVGEYAWLWENTLRVDPAKAELRTTFIASEMEWLAMRNAPAKVRFTALRDDTEKRLKDAPALDPLVVDDYLILNRVVGDEPRSLAWFDGVKTDASKVTGIPHLSQRVEQLLEANTRWKDLSTYFYIKPRELAQHAADANRAAVSATMKVDPAKRDMLTQTVERSYNARVSRLYASLLAAKRDRDAEAVLDIIAAGDAFGRTVLACITKGLDINEPRASMRKPLDDAWKKGAGIKGARDRLNKALK